MPAAARPPAHRPARRPAHRTRPGALGLLSLALGCRAQEGLLRVDLDPLDLDALGGSGPVRAFSTAPGAARGDERTTDLEPNLVALIDSATARIDLAAYTLDRPAVVEALLAAAERGVSVRMVTDGDELDDAGTLALIDAGVPVVARRAGDRIMHHKFLVVDSQAVWTGSTNLTDTDMLYNDNDALLIISEEVAAAYAEEHAEMFEGGRFGRSKDRSRPALSLPLGELDLSVRFSPSQDPVPAWVAAIEAAEARVWFATYSFTHDDVAQALIAAQERGLDVVGIFDEGQAAGSYSVDEALSAAGIPVYRDGNENARGFAGGKLHHKLLIVDGGLPGTPASVATGSTNWSSSGQQYNDENLVLLSGVEDASPWVGAWCERLRLALPVDPAAAPGNEAAGARCGTPALRINELLPDPRWADLGEEYIELVNAGDGAMPLAGLSLWDGAATPRHTFEGGSLGPGAALVLYDTGDHSDVPHAILSSSGRLGLNNGGERIRLTGPTGALIDAVSYPALPIGVAWNRAADGASSGGFRRHDRMPGAAGASSPGTQADGSPW